MRPMRMSGVGLALVISFAMDQIFCLAPSMRPDMEPVVSSTKQTSIFGLSFVSEGSSLARRHVATSSVHITSGVTAWFPLTLTLSPGEREKPAVLARISDVTPSGPALLLAVTESMWTAEAGSVVRARRMFLPLPLGEGRGEGD